MLSGHRVIFLIVYFQILKILDRKYCFLIGCFLLLIQKYHNRLKRYVKITNLENFAALKEKHKELGKILKVSEKHLNRIFFPDDTYSQSITEMGFSLDIIDKKSIEKSDEAYIKKLHLKNMEFFKPKGISRKQEYLNKKGVEAYQ